MYLIDTCSFIGYIETSERLPQNIRELIDNSSNIFLSQATLWEIAIKQTIKKLDLEMTISEIEKKCKENLITILPLRTAYFEKIQTLPLIHRDPFDRIIIATAIEEGLTLITNDSEIVKYKDVKTIW